ncbi:MAG: large-conductance mechanosensitive channel protein MscL [Oscillospiraceae bacterium]|nr:large-conductance mechanosensitive channel protein MscL [Oscillospiraceae bacterium]
MADEKKKGIVAEFKEFIARGNVIDMAVGVIMGGAFTPIVNSLVNDIVMPGVGLIIGNVDFSDLVITLKEADVANDVAAVTINYGVFINTLINFFVVALCIFALVKAINKLNREKEEKPEEPAPAPVPEPTAEEKLLTEIRDLLAENK